MGYAAELTSTLLSDSTVPSVSRIYAEKPWPIWFHVVKQKPKSKETPRSGEERVIPGTGLDQLPSCGCDKTPVLGQQI